MLVALFVFLLGAVIGSFVNVAVLRFGFSESPRHRSACQGCSAPLRWFELIPLISFLILRGRCARCESKISVQYPIVELGTGVLFAASYILLEPYGGLFHFFSLLALFLFWAAFVGAVVYDVRHTLIPVPFAAALVCFALLYRIAASLAAESAAILYDGLLGALLLGAIIGAIVLVTRMRGMGVGDISIAASMGLLLGWWNGLDALILSFWIGAAVGILLIIVSRFSPRSALPAGQRQLTMKSEVPFVPFLFAGTLIVAFSSISSFSLITALTALMF